MYWKIAKKLQKVNYCDKYYISFEMNEEKYQIEIHDDFYLVIC